MGIIIIGAGLLGPVDLEVTTLYYVPPTTVAPFTKKLTPRLHKCVSRDVWAIHIVDSKFLDTTTLIKEFSV